MDVVSNPELKKAVEKVLGGPEGKGDMIDDLISRLAPLADESNEATNEKDSEA
jgi:hypothetical protein